MQPRPHPNLDRLRLGIDAFARRDLPAIAEHFVDDVVWHYVGQGPLVGDYRGVDEVFMFFAKRAALSGDSFQLHVEQALADDAFVTMLARASASREGVEFTMRMAIVYRMHEGRVLEAWTIPADPVSEAKFYAS
jgi:uncharacterized protein